MASLSANFSDTNLLVGEIQLFVLARTIILDAGSSKKGGVVLLDETTPSLEVE